MIKIDLPSISAGEHAKAHPYPFQIARQTQEFIQGAIFYSVIADMSSGAYIRQKDALGMLEKDYMSHNGVKEDWELGWMLLGKYKDVFKITVFQNVLVSINSYWDWYIRNLGSFVIFSRNYIPDPVLDKKHNSDLGRIGFIPICHQIWILEKACDIGLGLAKEELESLKEMSLVRNLGLHNRWEVDQKYLDNTPDKRPWKISELRLFNSSELGLWHKNIIKAINKTSEMVAIKYSGIRSYPEK